MVRKTSSGEFHFTLVASDGRIVTTRESYQQKGSAMSTTASIQRSAGERIGRRPDHRPT
jgi:uncharacterized protein YegP (UPF0339 family)